MQSFMNQDFLLDTEVGRRLYHQAAAPCPIIDYHCHIDPRAIWEDRRYENLTQVWLGGDHYKWRLMRAAGVPERLITGDASDEDRFLAWAAVLGKAIGNPLYHWSHLELRRFFGYEGLLNRETAPEVWALCNRRLAEDGFSARGLILRSRVETLCTTDDPCDTLEWHRKLAADASFPVAVLPAFRPDRALNLQKPDYPDYLNKLAAVSGVSIDGWATLREALRRRMAFFAEVGCRLSDHGLEYLMFAPDDEATIDDILRRRLHGEAVSPADTLRFQTAFLRFAAAEYRRLGWTMQLHYGCKRDNNTPMFRAVGPDTGFDCIQSDTPSTPLADLLNALESDGALPRTILYSLNPQDDAAIDTVAGCFQNDEAVCRVQHGSAWWFNDHLEGMTRQLTSLAQTGYLAGFVGMLTDSRSFLSYPRHEFFRRILCRLLGRWVEEGLFPNDEATLAEIVRNVSYENAKRYFGFAAKG